MGDDFRRAFLWHLDTHDTKLTDIATATGVSLDVLKKLKTRPVGSTVVENAVLIAAYYGESVNQFIACADVSRADKLANLLLLLTPEERRLLESQILGLIQAHGRK